jgi:hypothetical protein
MDLHGESLSIPRYDYLRVFVLLSGSCKADMEVETPKSDNGQTKISMKKRKEMLARRYINEKRFID